MTSDSLQQEVAKIDKALSEKSLREFMEAGWSNIVPDDFIGGWHIDAICEHLEAVADGQIKNLIINVPPRHTKSLTVNVFWPAWLWGPRARPGRRFLTASYSSGLSTRDAVHSRRLMQCEWYQSLWGDRFKFTGDQNAKTRFENDRGGYRISTSVGGVGTGEGGDVIIVDDPNNVQEVEYEVSRDLVIGWWTGSISTRKNTKDSVKVLIQQRCHPDDLTGHILATNPEDYECLILPAEYEGRAHDRSTTFGLLGFRDPRTEINEILWKERFDEEEISSLKRELKWKAHAQLQQRPANLEGAIFQEDWFNFYEHIETNLDFIFQSWDLAFKDTEGSAYVSGQVWGAGGPNAYLLDEVHRKMTFTQTLQAITNTKEDWPETSAIYIEDKANGAAAIDSLKTKIEGIMPVDPEGSKTQRAMAISPLVESGNVFLPDRKTNPWVQEFINECVGFPRASYNDRVDAMSQALRQFIKMRAKLNRFKNLPAIGNLTRSSPLSPVN